MHVCNDIRIIQSECGLMQCSSSSEEACVRYEHMDVIFAAFSIVTRSEGLDYTTNMHACMSYAAAADEQSSFRSCSAN